MLKCFFGPMLLLNFILFTPVFKQVTVGVPSLEDGHRSMEEEGRVYNAGGQCGERGGSCGIGGAP
jgi:hypothetical protein